MPLPTDPNTAWPPRDNSKAKTEIKRADAWYSGDKDKLAEYALDQPEYAAHARRRLSFWSRDNKAIKRNLKMHLPLASDIAETSADLLFSEAPIVTVPEDATAAMARIETLITETSFLADLIEAAELTAALGGGYWRVTWDREIVPDHPIWTFPQADAAVPEFSWGRLRAVTFWRQLSPDGSKDVWRHLERHEAGSIQHGLYCGTATELGQAHPLNQRQETAGLAAGLRDDGVSVAIDLPSNVVTAGYIPNMRPNRADRGSPLGRADIAGQYDELDSLDEAWTSWMRDLRLGKSRLIVPKTMLQDNGPGRGSSFSYDKEIYEAVNLPPDSKDPITQAQFTIRVDEHERTCRALTEQIIQSSGYSLSTFGLEGDAGVTATEIRARQRRSMTTRTKKARYFAPELQRLIYTWLAVDRAVGFPGSVEPVMPKVEIGDSVAEDPHQIAETVNLLNAAAAASTETKVRIVHPDWNDDTVDAEVAKIHSELGQSVTMPSEFNG